MFGNIKALIAAFQSGLQKGASRFELIFVVIVYPAPVITHTEIASCSPVTRTSKK